MTDAIHAKCDVLGERELDAVSGGMLLLPLAAYTVPVPKDGGTSGGGGQNDPLAQMFQQILQQSTQGQG